MIIQSINKQCKKRSIFSHDAIQLAQCDELMNVPAGHALRKKHRARQQTKVCRAGLDLLKALAQYPVQYCISYLTIVCG